MIDSEAALVLSFFLWNDVGVAVLGVDPEFRRDMISISLKLSAIRKGRLERKNIDAYCK